MIVIVKKPGLKPEIIEVQDIEEVNLIVGNVDENGNGISFENSTDAMYEPLENDVDMYCNEWSRVNSSLAQNVIQGFPGIYGTVVFVSEKESNKYSYELGSLSLEQIKYVLDFIENKTVKKVASKD